MATNVLFETGDNLDEANVRLVHDALMNNASFVVSGYELHYDGAGLDIDVKAGTAVVNAYVIVSGADQRG